MLKIETFLEKNIIRIKKIIKISLNDDLNLFFI